MAKKKKQRVKSPTTPNNLTPPPTPTVFGSQDLPQGLFTSKDASKFLTLDSFSNPAARLGVGTDNLAEFTEYRIKRITRDMQLMNALYRNNWIVKRLIDIIPEDMMKNGYKLNTQLDLDSRRKLTRLERTTALRSKILEGLKWGRLYGGAAAIIVIDGHEEFLDEALELEMIMPDTFKGLIVLDRWSGITPETTTVEDYSDPNFGLPEYYTVRAEGLGSGTRIHHSRIVRFTGRDLPYIERIGETYWGASELEHIFDELKKRDNTSYNIAGLVFRANLHIYRMENMGEMALMPENVRQNLMKTITMLNSMMNNNGMQIIGSGDNIETKQYTFAGLSDIYELFMYDIAGAAEIPATKLFERSPSGMNATGESDMQNYYDSIEEKQESYLRPVYDVLLPIMCMSAFGSVPDDLDYDFEPVKKPTESERKQLASQMAQALQGMFTAGGISQKTLLKELQASSELTGMWNSISDEDIENADDGTMGGDLDFPDDMFAQGETEQEQQEKIEDIDNLNPLAELEKYVISSALVTNGIAKLDDTN